MNQTSYRYYPGKFEPPRIESAAEVVNLPVFVVATDIVFRRQFQYQSRFYPVDPPVVAIPSVSGFVENAAPIVRYRKLRQQPASLANVTNIINLAVPYSALIESSVPVKRLIKLRQQPSSLYDVTNTINLAVPQSSFVEPAFIPKRILEVRRQPDSVYQRVEFTVVVPYIYSDFIESATPYLRFAQSRQQMGNVFGNATLRKVKDPIRPIGVVPFNR